MIANDIILFLNNILIIISIFFLWTHQHIYIFNNFKNVHKKIRGERGRQRKRENYRKMKEKKMYTCKKKRGGTEVIWKKKSFFLWSPF